MMSTVGAEAAPDTAAARVLGVDVSERALAFAAMNAAVNLSRERATRPSRRSAGTCSTLLPKGNASISSS